MQNEQNPQNMEQDFSEPTENQDIAPVEFEETEIVQEPSFADPIYRHKDGRYFTKSQLLKDGVDETRIQNGINLGMITLIGDTDDPNQEFKHKDGRIFSVKQLMDDGVSQERILNGISIGMIEPLEKKNQVQNPLAPNTDPLAAVAKTDMSTSVPVQAPSAKEQKLEDIQNQQSQDFSAIESELELKSTTQPRKTKIETLDLSNEDLLNSLSTSIQKIQQQAQAQQPGEQKMVVIDGVLQPETTFQSNPNLPTLKTEEANKIWEDYVAKSSEPAHDFFADAISYDKDKNKKITATKEYYGPEGERDIITTEEIDQASYQKAQADAQAALQNGIDYKELNKYYNAAKSSYDPDLLKDEMKQVNTYLNDGMVIAANDKINNFLFIKELRNAFSYKGAGERERIVSDVFSSLKNLAPEVFTEGASEGAVSEVIITKTEKEDFLNRAKLATKTLNDYLDFGANDITNDQKEEIKSRFNQIILNNISRWSYKNPDVIEADPLAYTFNDEQIIGYRYVEAIGEQAKYAPALLSDADIKDNQNAQIAKQQAMKELANIGANVKLLHLNKEAQEAIANINFNKYSLENNLFGARGAFEAADYIKGQQDKYIDVTNRIQNINRRLNSIESDNEKYGLANYYERSTQLQEIFGQKYSGLSWVGLKAGLGVAKTAIGLYNMIKTPFLSDKEVQINMASLMGMNTRMNDDLYVRQQNQLGQKFEAVMTPELKAQMDKILNNDNLSYDEKVSAGYSVLSQNPDGFKLAPTGEESNVTLDALWYGSAGLAADLVPFLAVTYLTGGAGGAAAGAIEGGALKSFASQFTAAFLTGINDSYIDAVSRGVENPYSEAILTTTISSAAMAGAGTPDLIRKIIGTKNVAGNIINKMSDGEIMTYLRKKPASLLSFESAYGAAGAALKSTWDATKGGAKFVSMMTAAQVINDQITGAKKSLNDYVFDAKIEILKFAVFGGVTGTLAKGGQRLVEGDLNRAVYFQVAAEPKKFREQVQKLLDQNKISQSEAEQVNKNIDLAHKAYNKLYFFNANGEPLTDRQRRDLLYYKMQEIDIENVVNKDMPEKLKKDLLNRALDIKEKINQIYEGNYVTPENKQIKVLAQGNIVTGDVIKDKQGEYGQVVKVNENGSVIVRKLNGDRARMLWQPEQIDVERFAPETQLAKEPYNGATMTPVGTPGAPTETITRIEEKPTEVEVTPEGKTEVKPGEVVEQKIEEVPSGAPLVEQKVELRTKEEVDKSNEEIFDKIYENITGFDKTYIDKQLSEGVSKAKLLEDAATETAFDKNPELWDQYNANKQELKAIAEAPEVKPTEVAEQKIEKIPSEVPTLELPQQISEGVEVGEKVMKPTDEQISKDIKEKNFVSFTYDNESKVPEQFKDRISSISVINGKKVVKVTLPKSIADYELAKSQQAELSIPSEKIQGKEVAQAKAVKPDFEVIEPAEVQRQMKPITDKMVEIEREFENNGLEINWDYDNEISIKDKKTGELLDVEDVPESLVDMASQYEQATRKLAEYDQGTFIKALEDSRKITETEAEVIEPKKAEMPTTEAEFAEKNKEILKELANRKVPENKGKGNWRQIFNEDKNIFRKSAILRAIAESSNNIDELTDIRDAAKGMPEEGNIINEVNNKLKKIGVDVSELKPTEPIVAETAPLIAPEVTTPTVEAEPKKPTGAEPSLNKKLSDKIRALKIPTDKTNLQSNIAGIPIALYNSVIETVALAVEGGAALEEAISKAISKHRLNEISEFNRKELTKTISDILKEEEGAQAILPVEETEIKIRTKNPFLYDESSPKERQKGLMRKIMEAEEIPDEVKAEWEKAGIDKYKVASNLKAESIAQDLINTFGEKDALTIARGKDVHPSIRSAMFARLIDMAFEQGQKAKTESAKIAAAEKWKQLATEYANELTASGQFAAYAGHYYKISPMGFVMKENAERVERFDNWAEGKNKGFEQVWKELNESEAGAAFVQAKVDEALAQERKEARAKRDKKIDDFFEKAKLKGGTYLAAIPPGVWNKAMDILKEATKAGDRVAVAVQKAAEYISSQIGENWDKTRFSKDFTSKIEEVADGAKKEPVKESYAAILNRRKQELERRIREKDFSAEEYKGKRDLTEAEQQAKEQYDEVKKAYDEAKKLSPEWQEKKRLQYFDRFSKRLKGLNDDQKKEVIAKSLKTIVEKGGLEYQEFRNIIADVIGIKELTQEQIKKIESLTETINGIDDAVDKMVENPSKETIAAVEKARKDAAIAGNELQKMAHRPADFTGFINQMITGSLLTLITTVQNPVQNTITQATVRLPTALIRQSGESLAYTLSLIGNKAFGSKIIYPTKNILLAQKGYFGKGKEGLSRAWFDFYKGTQERDYFGKTSYSSGINPKDAVKDIRLWKQGEKLLTKKEVAERYARATIGWQADFILRTMAFGDKPFRWAAEGSEAIQIAVNELKLFTDQDVKAFMAAPKAFGAKILRERGMSAEEANRIAGEYEDRIIRSGQRATYEQDNLLSYISKKIDQKILKAEKSDTFGIKFLKGFGSVLKTSQFPFLKIPGNLYWQYYKVANPEISFGQAVFHSMEAAYHAKKGDKAAQRRALEDVKDNLALAAYGLSIRFAVAGLVSSGLVTPPQDDKTTPRERAGSTLYGKSDQIDLGTLMGGDSPYMVDLKWFGPVGTSISMEAAIQRNRKQKELKGEKIDDSYLGDLKDRLTVGADKALSNLVFDQGAELINAIRNGDADLRYFITKNLGIVSNMFTGSTLAAITKAMLPYEARLKADGLMQEIDNNLKYRNILYRLAFGLPPKKISIWGEPIGRDNSFWGVSKRLLGVSPQDPNQFGLILYNDFLRTMNPKFFPMPEDNKVKVNGEDVELTPDQKSALEMYVGKARKALVQAFVYDCATPYKVTGPDGKTHSYKYSDKDLSDEEKVKMLQKIYEYGKEIGINQFKTEFPQFADAEISTKEMIIKEKNSLWGTMFKEKMQQAARKKGLKAPELTPEEEELLDQLKKQIKQAAEVEPPQTQDNNTLDQELINQALSSGENNE